MSSDDRLDRRIQWTSRASLLLLALILTIAVWTLATVSIGQGDELEALDAQNDLLREQNDSLAALNERQRVTDDQRDERLQGAIDEIEALLVDYFALHDTNTAEKLNEALQRIAVLVDRPAPEPIRAAAAPRYSQVSSTSTTRPTATQPSSTTTTSPGQSDLCERNPSASPCRSNR